MHKPSAEFFKTDLLMNPNRAKLRYSVLLVITVFSLTGLIAGAQENDPPPSTDTNAPASLPPITVVARKQPAAVQSVPLSVTPVPYSTIKADDIRYVKDAELYAPNVFLNEFSARKLSNPRIPMRNPLSWIKEQGL